MNFMWQTLRNIIFLLLLLALVACSQINQTNFDKVKTGMTMQQVTQILGQPSDVTSMDFAGISGTSATWKTKNTTIVIQFINDTVKLKIMNKVQQQ